MYEKQKNKIRQFYKTHKHMPSYREIMNLLGYKSKNAVHKLVKKLAAEDFISQDPRGRLIPNQLYGEIKVLGLIEAGFPSPAEEELLDTVSLDNFLIKNKEASYILRVRGNSMIDAGIFEEDLVIAEKTNQAKTGDIVIAEIDGEWTMKYLKKNGKDYYLEPANKDYPCIYPESGLRIAAV
ncbi:transcriptional repressor LexA, partial [Patescibacteria group bacterium]|nr:transcriptional repressor LexA [Patescibacteria group bacterium]MBU1868626.1 transcriptional repressor LexA [Patescibacteria group bacterium]